MGFDMGILLFGFGGAIAVSVVRMLFKRGLRKDQTTERDMAIWSAAGKVIRDRQA